MQGSSPATFELRHHAEIYIAQPRSGAGVIGQLGKPGRHAFGRVPSLHI